MKALVYLGPGKQALQEHANPEIIASTDAIVRVTRTTICGTDLHILKGDVPSCVPGTVLGHEGVGVIDSVGAGVTTFKPGDRVRTQTVAWQPGKAIAPGARSEDAGSAMSNAMGR